VGRRDEHGRDDHAEDEKASGVGGLGWGSVTPTQYRYGSGLSASSLGLLYHERTARMIASHTGIDRIHTLP